MSSWIANLPLKQKFALLCLVGLVMTAVPTVVMVKGAKDTLAATQAEVAGMPPSQDMLEVIKRLQVHRGLSAGVLSGDVSKRNDMLAAKAKVDEALAHAEASMSTLSQAALSASLAKVSSEWKTLSGDVSGGVLTGAVSVARHTALVMIR